MKLKNVVVGSDIEAKVNIPCDCDLGYDIVKGDRYEVVNVDYNDTDLDIKIIVKDVSLWYSSKDFRKPRVFVPNPRKLDQSIFDGVDSKYSYFAIDEDGRGGFYDQKPELCGDCFTSGYGWQPVGYYDATDWKSSLIERESKELTGSELCKAMIERGDKYVMCLVGTHNDAVVIEGMHGNEFIAIGMRNLYSNPKPINNQGEPLTAKDVGL